MDSNEFVVKVRNPYKQGEAQQVEQEAASPAVKVASIKEAIRSKTKLDINRQRLIFQGKLMRDEDNIADFKVSQDGYQSEMRATGTFSNLSFILNSN